MMQELLHPGLLVARPAWKEAPEALPAPEPLDASLRWGYLFLSCP
jgi:hypothetical protein